MDMVRERIRRHGRMVSVRVVGSEDIFIRHIDGYEHALIFPSPIGASGRIVRAKLLNKSSTQAIHVTYAHGDRRAHFFSSGKDELPVEPGQLSDFTAQPPTAHSTVGPH